MSKYPIISTENISPNMWNKKTIQAKQKESKNRQLTLQTEIFHCPQKTLGYFFSILKIDLILWTSIYSLATFMFPSITSKYVF